MTQAPPPPRPPARGFCPARLAEASLFPPLTPSLSARSPAQRRALLALPGSALYDSSSPTPSKQPVLAMSISGEVDEGDFATARRGGGEGEERIGE